MCPFTLSAVVYILLAGVEESTDTYKRVCSKIPHKMQMETLSACSIQKWEQQFSVSPSLRLLASSSVGNTSLWPKWKLCHMEPPNDRQKKDKHNYKKINHGQSAIAVRCVSKDDIIWTCTHTHSLSRMPGVGDTIFFVSYDLSLSRVNPHNSRGNKPLATTLFRAF